MRDLLTRSGAGDLAYELDRFWHSKGHGTVKHWVQAAKRPHSHADAPDKAEGMWVVRSNLVGGLPPKEVSV